VALEVADVRVVVGGDVSHGIVYFCAGVDDALRVVREARKVDAIFMTLELFSPLAFSAIVDVKCVVIASYDGELA